MARRWDTRIWVVVADGERARVLMPDNAAGRFRTWLRLGTVEGSHCPPPLRNQPLDQARNVFAVDLAHRLDEEAGSGSYDQLVLLAPGRVLHELREVLGDASRSRLLAALPAEGRQLDDRDASSLVAHLWRAPAEAA